MKMNLALHVILLDANIRSYLCCFYW